MFIFILLLVYALFVFTITPMYTVYTSLYTHSTHIHTFTHPRAHMYTPPHTYTHIQEPGNPIMQDVKKGKPRYYTYGVPFFNYGLLPQVCPVYIIVLGYCMHIHQ